MIFFPCISATILNMTEVFKVSDEDWSPGSCNGILEVKPQVVIHDRLMTDAVLGACNIPIKTEHSYCSSHPETAPDSALDKIDDLEDECYPALPLNCVAKRRRSNSSQDESPDSPIIVVKDEPMSDVEPDSPVSSCPSSPQSSHEYEEKPCQNILRQPATALLLATKANLLSQHGHRVSISGIKVETGSSGFSLPPTPPSSTSSDSEGNVSPDHPSSPSRPIYLTNHGSSIHSTRQPIQTPLISCQPKGSTGILILTDEEKRTLLAEGYPIPTKLPLTKAEEKSLKKIRRKIKNKISAQESRRKKKEYMDALEKKVEILSSENSEYKKRISSLEDSNTSLVSQLNKLQALITRHSPHLISSLRNSK